ncbi:MAG TPA: VCBS repeat-containing protein [Pyrinomonadaceae bacterium]
MRKSFFAGRDRHQTVWPLRAFVLLALSSLLGYGALSQTANAKRVTDARARSERVDAAQRPQTVFTNPNLITITDADNATPYPSTITVSGLTGNIPSTPGSVKVTFNGFTHSFPDDVGIVLVGPTGAALLIQDAAGDDPDMDGVTYTLSDNGADFLPDDLAWGPGTYKPSAYFSTDIFPAPGPGAAYDVPGPTDGSTATFASTFGGTNPNGVWSLYVADFADEDSGLISGGWNLEINTGPPPPPTRRAAFDFDGDNKTDYAVVRTSGGALNWYLQRSTAGFAAQPWGSSGDQLASGDYDGDGKWDIAVWRAGIFYILKSSDGTLSSSQFGQSGDVAFVSQDFDGDGKTDPAVVRNVGGSWVWYMQRSTAGFGAATFGTAVTDILIRGDFDGDGKADVAVYRTGIGGGPENTFFVLRSSDGGVSSQTFGRFGTDAIVPSDFDGDGKTDYAVYRGVVTGDNGVWYWLNSSDGSFHAIPFGQAGTDFHAVGDYDGDGKDDQAVWRPGAPGVFYVNGSTSGFTAFPFGTTGDRIPANTRF